MSIEIIVVKNALREAESDMTKLCSQVSNRNMTVSFSKSKGNTVDEILEMAEELNQLKDALHKLYAATGEAIKRTREEFEKTDRVAGDYFRRIGELMDES